MLKSVLVTVLAGAVVVFSEECNSICDGTYKIDNVQKCDNPEQYKFDFEITKKKINRTHDGFSLTCDLPEEFSEDYGMILDVYTKCDGGYKLSDTYNFPSLCNVINQHVKTEFENFLTAGGINPPNCPIPQGWLEVVDYIIDNGNIPKQSKCGQSKNEIYILDNQIKVACILAYVTVSPLEDDEDDDTED